MDNACETLDFTRKGLSKIEKATDCQAKSIVTLIFDENELQRLDNVETYVRIENLSVCRNELIRMYGVSRLLNLRSLTLNDNAILTIEGLKQLIYLKKLCLSGNNIKSIEHLNHNIHLEHLDLSNNQISFISDISYLKHLKHLYLDKNRVTHLRQCDRYLPASLVSLGLSRNNMCDLNEIGHLAHLSHMENFNIEGNPCVCLSGQDKIGFDYRPFVINWLMTVKTIDGYAVNAIESLKAEWLYSQGRGRSFRTGEQAALISYLSTTCPLTADALETEEQRKLRLILSKAQHHQQQLRDQTTTGSPPARTRIQSPRMHARMAARATKSPDRMSNSIHSSLSHKPNHFGHLIQTSQMSSSFSGELSSTPSRMNDSILSLAVDAALSQSYDATINMFGNEEAREEKAVQPAVKPSPQRTKEELDSSSRKEKETKDLINKTTTDWKPVNQPLEAASKMMPVPESMISPDYHGPTFIENQTTTIHMEGVKTEGVGTQECIVKHDPAGGDAAISKIARLNCGKNPTHTPIGKHISNRGKQGSPKMTRSAMSSPKPKYKQEHRKGSFSTKSAHSLNEKSTARVSDSEIYSNISGEKMAVANNRIEVEATPPDTKVANSSDDDNDIMSADKLRVIKAIANGRRQKRTISDSNSSEGTTMNGVRKLSSVTPQLAAVTIQKVWRGYRIRNLCQDTAKILNTIQNIRAKQYIEKLSTEMEATKTALESERKIQQLQMQAINALWKKVSTLQGGCSSSSSEIDIAKLVLHNKNNSPGSNDTNSPKVDTVKQLVETCNVLQVQVQQLQGSMRDVLRYMSALVPTLRESEKKDGVATQTEISAVHTPQGEVSTSWPYLKVASRPCSLPLSTQTSNTSPQKLVVSGNSITCSDTSKKAHGEPIVLVDEVVDSDSYLENSCGELIHYNDDTSEGITMEERINDGDMSKCTDDELNSTCESPGGEVTPVA